jgi:hypothetical protein
MESNKPFVECYFSITLPTLHKPNQKLIGYSIGTAKGSISEFVKNNENISDILKDIETGIKRIKDEYPIIRHEIEKECDEIHRDNILSYLTVHIEWGEHTTILN